MSSLTSAKHLKCLASYTESEILAGVSLMSEDDREAIHGISQRLVNSLESVDRTRIKVIRIKRKRATNQELLVEVLLKINQNLASYEKSDKVDKWIIHFEVGVLYESLSIDDIINVHRSLIKSSLHVEQTRLLIYAERGRLYDNLKFSDKWSRKWKALCKDLDICSYTAKRYIDFYRITNAFPRLLICDVNFETIMLLYSELSNYLNAQENQQLKIRLQQPLRNTIINSDMVIAAEKLPHGGDPPTRSLSQDADWNAAWELSDIIIKKPDTDSNSHDDDCEEDDLTNIVSQFPGGCSVKEKLS